MTATSAEKGPAFSLSRTALNGDGFAIQIEGELDLSNASEFKEQLRRVIDGIESAITLDLCQCAFIDSTVISLLVELGDQQKQAGHPLALVASGQPQKVLELTGVFESGLFPSRELDGSHSDGGS
jgi:anti-anti-sigma factor